MENESIYDCDDAVICENCGNVFKVILLKEGDEWNDFGYRHCPFCGLLTDEYAHVDSKRIRAQNSIK